MVIQLLRTASRMAVGLTMLLPLQALSGTAAAAVALPAQHVSFRVMEGEMPSDPLLASADPMWKDHATPSPWLDDARAQLTLAVPHGTSTLVAVDRMRAAGARCRQNVPDVLSCRYHGVETRDEYVDDVQWQVNFTVNQGTVDRMSVSRTWTRH